MKLSQFTQGITHIPQGITKVARAAQELPRVIQDCAQSGHRARVEIDKCLIRSKYRLDKSLGQAHPLEAPERPTLAQSLSQLSHNATNLASATVENGKYALQGLATTVVSPLQSIQSARAFWPHYAQSARGAWRVAAGMGAGCSEAAHTLVGMGELAGRALQGGFRLTARIASGEVDRYDVADGIRWAGWQAYRGASYLIEQAPGDVADTAHRWMADPAYEIPKDLTHLGATTLLTGGLTRAAGGAAQASLAGATTRVSAVLEAGAESGGTLVRGASRGLASRADRVARLINQAESAPRPTPRPIHFRPEAPLPSKPALPSRPPVAPDPVRGRLLDLVQNQTTFTPSGIDLIL